MNALPSLGKNLRRWRRSLLWPLTFGIITAALCPLIPLAGAAAPAPVLPTVPNDHSSADNPGWIMRTTQQYSPASWNVFLEYDRLPAELESSRKGGWVVAMKKPAGTFPQLTRNDRKTELIDKMAQHLHFLTLALQRLHVFRHTRENNILMDWERAEAFFDLSGAGTFYVSFPMKSLYPSSELTAAVPDSLRTALFDAHIKECKAAQRFGVIGLLEEFHAHYAEARFYADMLPAYRLAEGSEADGLLAWVQNSQGSIGAFYEFDFFILEYLLYMKRQYAADYEALKSCRPFVDAYGAIRSLYGALADQFMNTIRAETRRLNSPGKTEAGYTDNILWIRTGDSNRGARVFTERQKLASAADSIRHAPIIADFSK
ncbi:MAG: hypothetical protein EG826_15205 [Deltaproteobacteria bacterium]|nr:hypothetical protein [Deltaproteobacteria bacterium]